MTPTKLGRYEIQDEIGRGAMGVVYRAIDPVLDRTVAIKTIAMSTDQGERAEYEARFYQEAKAAGGLSHPNIVTVYDVGDSGDVAYMALEFLQGTELGDLLADGRPVPVDKTLEIAAQVADGLGYAHDRGVVHRDIKPANIMILHNGLAKITDFGIARMRQSEVKTQTGILLGSPRYMSPEVVLGKRADGRSDIFSLGIIMYEMLTGAAPFTGETMGALMFQTINVLPPAPSTVNPTVPPMLDFIVAKMLAKNRDERYPNAMVLAADVRECLAQVRQAKTAKQPAAVAQARSAPSLLDAEAKSELLAASAQMTRVTDSGKDEVATAPTLGISHNFDSLEATQRLAVQTGMAQEFSDYAATLKISAPVDTAAATAITGAQSVPDASRASGPRRVAWGRREWWILALGLSASVVIAALIAFA
ncbi:MAG: hypothetical protein A3G25_19065 [Betaproteobacteria bacterium RIFCSPLOWO2_12_FULL_63_13]|nr:MAG: hypothetical protein A3H32_14795 [Betaproteobacteria bacterium RIFCSPLOWO2_02_FULL_63_19]OGA42623.1 MAG: hypothetical protein A3G25_19065 [Betaproteobacteria bacterium RIFCSPLOWO2_12_FULL_63_13]